MRKIVLRVLARDDPDFLEFKSLIEKLDDIIFESLDQKFVGKSDHIIFDYVNKIHDHVMT